MNRGDTERWEPANFAPIALCALVVGLGGCSRGDTHWERDAVVPGSHFHGVHGLAFDADDRLFVGDVLGQAIYEVRLDTRAVEPFVASPLGEADDLEFGPDGTLAWTAFFAGEVRARRPNGEIVTLASGHPGFNSLAFAPDGRLYATTVFLGDELYEIDLAGEKPARLVAKGFGGLNGFDFGSDGHLYGPLFTKGKVARVNIETGEVSVIAEGFGVPAAVNLNSKDEIFVIDTARGEVVRVDAATGGKTVLSRGAAMIDNLAFDSADRLFISNASDNAVIEIDASTGEQTVYVSGQLSVPGDLAFDPARNQLLVPDVFTFRTVALPDHRISEIARAFARELHLPYFVAAGVSSYAVSGIPIGDLSPGSVQIFDAKTGEDTVLDGFKTPHGLLFEDPNHLLVAEFDAGTVVRVDVGNPSEREIVARKLGGPVGLARGADGALYVSEFRAGVLSRLELATGARKVVAEGLAGPEGIDVFPDGRIAVAEVGARRIVAIDPTHGQVTVLAEGLPIGLDLPDSLPPVGLPTGVAAVDDDTLYFVSDLETAIYRLTRPTP
jgi:sugar lactone lactonase YvrE